MKKFLSLLLCFVTVMSIFAVAPISTAASAEADRITEQINTTYSQAKSLSGKSNFSDDCSVYVIYQLIALGITSSSDSDIKGNGNQMYNNITSGTTSTGYTKTKYSGNNCLYNIINSNSGNVYNIVVSWDHGYDAGTWSYGHVLFIHAIIDNTVYFSENYAYNYGSIPEGSPLVMSLSTFMSKWNGMYGNAIGAVHFTKSHTHSYDTYAWYEDAHPHYKCYKCTCGAVQINTSQTTYLPDCPNCQVYAPNQNLGDVFYSTIINSYLGTAVTGVDGNDVKSYALNGSLKQWWKFENCGNNEYEITNCYYGKCLDVYCGLNANNTNVDLYTDNDTIAQRWYIKSTNNGYILVSKCAPTLSIDIENTSGNDGVNIQIYKCSANNAQVFSIPFRLNAQPCDLGVTFDSKIINTASGKALTDKDGDLLMYETDGTYSQAWKFVKDVEGSYQIFSYKNWGKCVDVYCGLTINETAVQLYDCNDTNAQKWFIVKENNKYRFIPRCSTNLTLDVIGGSSLNGTGLQIYEHNNTDAQYFYLDATTLPFDILDLGDSFTSKIINDSNEKYVIGTINGNVELNDQDIAMGLIWIFDKNADGSYQITNVEYQKCLDVKDGSQYNNTNVGLYEANETDAQKWYLVPVGDGVVFVPVCALMRAMNINNTNIEIYTYQETSTQKFKLEIIKEQSETALGDVDGDNEISVMDATFIQRHLAQIIAIAEDKLICADTDKDGEVSVMDATRIQRFIAQIIPQL